MINKYLILKILIITFLSLNLNSNENKIIFKINDQSFTSVDLDNRKKYINFIGENQKLSDKEIRDDYIGVNIFYEFNLKSFNQIKVTDKDLDIIFNRILDQNIELGRKFEDKLEINNILENLKLDLIRKNILEGIINTKKKELEINQNVSDLLYSYNIKYINFSRKDIFNYYDEYLNTTFNNLNEVESFLDSKQVNYFSKFQEVININNIKDKIKDKINEKNYFFKINNNLDISFVSITKNFLTYDGLIVKLLSVKNNSALSSEILNCNIMNSNNNNLEYFDKEYEYSKLNKEIKNNLLDVNDYVLFINNNEYNYIFLCGIKFNEDVLNTISLNKKVFKLVKEIENNFFIKYSSLYNLAIYE